LPVAEKKVETNAATTVVMGKNPETDTVEIYLNGDLVQSTNLAESANLLESLLKNMFEGFSEEGKEVRLKCDKALEYKDYSTVLTAIGNAGGAIAIIHEER